MRALLLSFLLLLLLAPGTQAAGLVHLGPDGNVWVTSADGSLQRQVTTDGTADAPYSPPAVDDAGTIVSFGHPGAFTGRLIGFDGADVRDPVALPASPCSTGPGSAAITPDGALIAATWTDGRRGCADDAFGWHHPRTTTSVLFGDAPTPLVGEPGAPLPSFRGRRAPRWLGAGTPRLAAIRHDAIEVQVAGGADARMERWLGVDHHHADLDSFDLRRAGDLLLLETSADGHDTDGEARRLELRRVTGTPPAAATERLCSAELAGDATGPALPRWSPDGTMISWTAADGIRVSPAPVPGADGQCVLEPRLVAPGGRDAAWTPADLPSPAVAAPDEEAPARTGAPPSTIKKITGAPKLTATARIIVDVTLRSARTIRVRVERLPAAGRKGRARLVGTLRFSGRAGRNPLVISKVGGKELPGGRYRLTITAFRHAPKSVVVTLAG